MQKTRRERYGPQSPPVLRTFAVPAPGVQVGGEVSEPDANPPPVAFACTKPPLVSHAARASEELPSAVDLASQFSSADDSARLPAVAVAFAEPPLTSQFPRAPEPPSAVALASHFPNADECASLAVVALVVAVPLWSEVASPSLAPDTRL